MLPAYPKLPAAVQRAITLLVVHCSATPSGASIGARPEQTIDRWHVQRGFARQPAARVAFNAELAAIGYHYVIDLDGSVYTGRSLEEIGAHVAGYNTRSAGICLVGGAERVGRYSLAQWQALRRLVQDLAVLLRSPRVTGHRELSPDLNKNGRIEADEWQKTCPGFSVPDWIAGGMQPLPQNLLPTSTAAATGAA